MKRKRPGIAARFLAGESVVSLAWGLAAEDGSSPLCSPRICQHSYEAAVARVESAIRAAKKRRRP